MYALEIHPGVPTNGVDKRGLDDALIGIDATTLTWAPDHRKAQPRTAPLPGQGPEAVSLIVQAGWRSGDAKFSAVDSEQLLFVSEGGRCLWTSRQYFPGSLAEVWPLARLRELEHVGITSRTEHFANARDLNMAYPGAAGRARTWGSPPLLYVAALLTSLALAGIVLLVLALS